MCFAPSTVAPGAPPGPVAVGTFGLPGSALRCLYPAPSSATPPRFKPLSSGMCTGSGWVPTNARPKPPLAAPSSVGTSAPQAPPRFGPGRLQPAHPAPPSRTATASNLLSASSRGNGPSKAVPRTGGVRWLRSAGWIPLPGSALWSPVQRSTSVARIRRLVNGLWSLGPAPRNAGSIPLRGNVNMNPSPSGGSRPRPCPGSGRSSPVPRSGKSGVRSHSPGPWSGSTVRRRDLNLPVRSAALNPALNPVPSQRRPGLQGAVVARSDADWMRWIMKKGPSRGPSSYRCRAATVLSYATSMG